MPLPSGAFFTLCASFNILFMYFILLPGNGIDLKLTPHISPAYNAVFFSWQNWGEINLFLQELFCDLFCNRQVAYIICCSCSHTKTKHSECDCLLLLTTDINSESIFNFSVSPPLMQKIMQHVKYDSLMISILLFVCLEVFCWLKGWNIGTKCWTGVTIFSAKS